VDVRFLSAAFLSVITLVAIGPARAATAAPRANALTQVALTQVALTQAQVIKRFEAATGRKLAVDSRSGNAGHYSALRLAKSVSNSALYGDFTLWVVAPGTLEDDIARLLTNVHTGLLGAPGAAGIYWEQGTYLGGQTYWLGKKRYGANLVVWRYGAEPKVDPSFKRLHNVLLTKVLTTA
jgi:hypothetical protein